MLAVAQIAAVNEELVHEAVAGLPPKAKSEAVKELQDARLRLARLSKS